MRLHFHRDPPSGFTLIELLAVWFRLKRTRVQANLTHPPEGHFRPDMSRTKTPRCPARPPRARDERRISRGLTLAIECSGARASLPLDPEPTFNVQRSKFKVQS